jgi:protein SCO1
MTITKVLLSMVGMAVLAAVLFYAEHSASARPWDESHFPNVQLVTQEGKKVRLYDDLLKGKTVLVNTFFAGCGDVCPLSAAKMLELKRLFGDRVGKDIFFYSISIDPMETPQTLQAYAEKFKLGAGWMLLTGAEKDVQQATRKLGLGVLQGSQPRENHSTTLMVGNEATGQWMKNSSTDNLQFLAASIQTFLGWPNTVATQNYAQAKAIPHLTNGQYLFQNGCKACHTIGGGASIGPDLIGVRERRDPAWLERFILVPDEVIAAKDPIALELLRQHKGVPMPNLGLAREDVHAILSYIDAQTATVRGKASSTAAASHH